MKKLWEKDKNNLDPFVEYFETHDDIIMDQKLIEYDIKSSSAHAKQLNKIGILTDPELHDAEKGLAEILQLASNGKFVLEVGDEDIHTKIENYLTEKYGEVGKKIHTGRSRNDQVLTMLRLFEKEMLEKVQIEVKILIKSFQEFDKKYGAIATPGYTHMQKAMPSSIGLWAKSFIASFEDDAKILEAALKLIDQSPLGTGAGYGVPLELDRKYTASLLGFKKVLENPIYAQSSRGKFEAFVLSSLTQVLQTINKFASDVLLFTTSEFGFFEAISTITTGSSIMPQKKNLDLAELLRSKVHIVLGNYTQIVSMSANLPSGYNRDLQDIKKPLVESLETTYNSIKAAKILIGNITPNEEKLAAAMTQELFATEKALKHVKKGENFRDAYTKVKEEYEQ